MITYEEALDANSRWALSQGSKHFRGDSEVMFAMRRVAAKLDALNVPYAVAGGMALFGHGYRRFTEDVDIVVTREGLQRVHQGLEGLGYVAPFQGSKNLRDTEAGVKIEFLVTGQFPGDGKPKPVAFPDPSEVFEKIDGVKVIRLETLIEMKLASGMTGGLTRMKDFTDVVEVMKVLGLDASFASKLNPYVRERYLELVAGLAEGDAENDPHGDRWPE